jgi:excisionase family DNA binding protein
MSPLLSLKEAAQVLGVSFWSIRRLISLGKPVPVHVGRRVLLEPSTIEAFIAANRKQSHATREVL